MTQIKIVFDGPPGPKGGCFVEVEDENGKSFSAGTWFSRPDGNWELRMNAADIIDTLRELREGDQKEISRLRNLLQALA